MSNYRTIGEVEEEYLRQDLTPAHVTLDGKRQDLTPAHAG